MERIQSHPIDITEKNNFWKGAPAKMRQKVSNRQGVQENRKSVYVGETNFFLQNQIGQKKVNAQRDAMRKILEVFESDAKLDQIVKDSDVHKNALLNQIDQYDSEIQNIERMQQELKEEYGIKDDSLEEQNLCLIRKSLGNPMSITKEEMAQLEEMGTITNYQRSSLELDAMKEVWQDLKEKAKLAYAGEGQQVEDIMQARLKVDPMVGAQKEAKAIKEQVSDSVLAMLLEDAKEKMEEKFNNPIVIKKNNEEEERQETKEEFKTKNETNVTENMTEEQRNILDRLKQFIKKQKILQEDTLGVKIDQLI